MSTPHKSRFGQTKDGAEVSRFTLENAKGERVELTDYGATIVSIFVLDKKGQLGNVNLGYDDVSKYEEASPYFGATIGRYGNRISKGGFTLDGQFYSIANNSEGATSSVHLHGGHKGFDKVIWDVKEHGLQHIIFVYHSPDGEEGYPGALDVELKFTWSDAGELGMEYRAQTNKKTAVNLTNHSYFNLKGAGEGNVLEHELEIHSKEIVPTDINAIPTGELMSVEGTPFDFQAPKAIGRDIGLEHEQLKFAGGYDHTFTFGDGVTVEPRLVAKVREAHSGRVLEVLTTEPGIQLYTGNFLGENELPLPSGRKIEWRGGFCLETQHYPDSVNNEHFPSVWLAPEEVYKTSTTYRFSVEQ
jgi:aldose 1-epimerase